MWQGLFFSLLLMGQLVEQWLEIILTSLFECMLGKWEKFLCARDFNERREKKQLFKFFLFTKIFLMSLQFWSLQQFPHISCCKCLQNLNFLQLFCSSCSPESREKKNYFRGENQTSFIVFIVLQVQQERLVFLATFCKRFWRHKWKRERFDRARGKLWFQWMLLLDRDSLPWWLFQAEWRTKLEALCCVTLPEL